MRVVISSGHGALVRGAAGIIDEVDEARRVVDHLALVLGDLGVEVETFHDDTSTSQNQNLETIVEYHNSHNRDLDVSVHFNAYEPTTKPMGTEVLYITAKDKAKDVVDAIAVVGLINRGAKLRNDLYFLNHTDEPAILIEVCFVDSEADVAVYQANFDRVCELIANGIIAGDGQDDAA